VTDKIQKIINNLWEHFPIQLLFKLVNDFPVSSEVVFRGFQRKVHSLSNPVVNKRLREEMIKNEKMADELIAILELNASDTCAALSEIDDVTDNSIIELAAKFNKENIAIALTVDEREKVNEIFTRIDELIPDAEEEIDDKPAKQDIEANAARWQHKCEMLEKKLQKFEDQMSKLKKERVEQINNIKDLEKEIENLNSQINKQKIELSEVVKECSSYQKQIERLERNIKKESEAKSNFEKENAELKSQILTLKNKPAEKEIITEEKIITEHIIHNDKKNKVKEAIALLSSIFTEKNNEDKPTNKSAAKPKLAVTLKTPATAPVSVPPKVSDKIKIMSEGKLLDLTPTQVMAYLKQNNKRIVDAVRTHYNKLVAPHDKELLNTLIKAKIPNQIICGPLKPAIIDGSNVAHFTANGERPKLEHLIQLRHTCWLEGYFPVYIIVDASLPYQIDNEAKLSEMMKQNEVIAVSINTVADKEILKRAIELNAVVLTNDRYSEWPDGDKVSKRYVIQSRNIMKPGDYHHKNGINWGKL